MSDFVDEIKAFARGGQLDLLSRVLSNMAIHFGVPHNRLHHMLYKSGLTMKQIEKQLAGVALSKKKVCSRID